MTLTVTRIGTDNNAPGTPKATSRKSTDEQHHGIQGEATAQQDWRDEIGFEQMQQQIERGRKQPPPQRIECEQPTMASNMTPTTGPK